ncbi:MAG: hypothetical protein RXP92_02595 [Candidatus Micrarchaeota archaeon]
MKIRFAEIVFIALLSIVIFIGVEIVYSFLMGIVTFSEFLLGLELDTLAFILSFAIYLYLLYFEPITDPDTLEKWDKENNNQEKEAVK